MPSTTLSPIASAPAATAARTPASSVTPQIFTNGRRATLAGSSGAAPAATKARAAAVGSPARTSASPTSAPSNPSARQRATVRGSRTPDSAIDQPIVGDQVAQAPGALDVDLERPQVAVVEPDQPRPAGERPVELARVVDLDERLQPERQRPLDEARESPGRVEDGEQQHEIGAGGAEERQLDVVDHEVLGEDRDRDRGPHRAQVVDRATEPVRLAQHRDRRRAAGLVGAGPRDDVLVVGRDPSGGR